MLLVNLLSALSYTKKMESLETHFNRFIVSPHNFFASTPKSTQGLYKKSLSIQCLYLFFAGMFLSSVTAGPSGKLFFGGLNPQISYIFWVMSLPQKD